jgi:aminomethyltransferase
MVAYAGWEMPVRYDGVIAEHLAVRSAVGAFDVSHMGQIETTGPAALDLLMLLCTNDVARIPISGAQYTLLCREDGGVLDDLITYRLEAERYLTVTNASNHERDLAWFQANAAGFDAEVIDRAADYAMISVQGPLAREVVQAVASAPLPDRMTISARMIDGVDTLVAGTGYTGGDGVELLLAPADALGVWNAVLRRGAKPAGLAARDTLRTEACLHLYGNELSTERGPIEAGLGWCCRPTGGYIGAEAVATVRAAGRRGDRRRGRDQRHLLAEPRDGDRHGLPARGAGGPGDRVRDRRARQAPARTRRDTAAVEGVSTKPIESQTFQRVDHDRRRKRADGRSVLSAGVAVPP